MLKFGHVIATDWPGKTESTDLTFFGGGVFLVHLTPCLVLRLTASGASVSDY